MLFDEATLRKLTRLTLIASQVRAGRMKGERRSSRKGASLEFADYRDYSPGDDLRRLDWKAYARLDRAFLKLFEEEEDLAVHILLDGSQSMDWGEGEAHKFTYALRIAGALGAIALAEGDQLSVHLLTSTGSDPNGLLGPLRGAGNTLRLLRHLEGLQPGLHPGGRPGGETDLAASLRAVAASRPRPGLVFLISDLLSPTSFAEGLAAFLRRGSEAVVIQVLAPDELDPPLAGDLRLVDVETDLYQEVSLDSGARRLYRQRLGEWQAGLQAAARKYGARWTSLSTAEPWDQVVQASLWKAGVLQ
ncbi:MAG TPA: DUF58 domain-containing protein [Anaerolineales bacterium]|nr:DUF58 domain-containing protein [Anaerolineales bacterium]